MSKFTVYPNSRFFADEMNKYIIRISWTRGEVIYKILLPHLSAGFITVMISTVPRKATLSP